MYEREIELKIRELPENLKKEVLDYVEFLLEKYKRKKSENSNSDGKMLYLRWLRNLRQLNYSINRWGGDNVPCGHEHILGNFWSHGIPGIFISVEHKK